MTEEKKALEEARAKEALKRHHEALIFCLGADYEQSTAYRVMLSEVMNGRMPYLVVDDRRGA
jgi:hypothetical protein